jgi:hypothetical protein
MPTKYAGSWFIPRDRFRLKTPEDRLATPGIVRGL